jgi:hypothetical protein
MVRSSTCGARGRLVISATIGGLAAIVLALLPALGANLLGPSPGWNEPSTAYAQADMDVDIVTSKLVDLPLEVAPGEQFTITVATAAGAGCSGQVEFRAQPPIGLDGQSAPGGTCSWPVDVPLTAPPGTGTITVSVARNGQGWTAYGVVYVRPVGE